MSSDNYEVKQKKEEEKGFPLQLKLFFMALVLCVIVLILKILSIF
jgi:hypothetical protein